MCTQLDNVPSCLRAHSPSTPLCTRVHLSPLLIRLIHLASFMMIVAVTAKAKDIYDMMAHIYIYILIILGVKYIYTVLNS